MIADQGSWKFTMAFTSSILALMTSSSASKLLRSLCILSEDWRKLGFVSELLRVSVAIFNSRVEAAESPREDACRQSSRCVR